MTTRITAVGRVAPCGSAPGIIDRVGHHPDRLRSGKGPDRLPGDPSPILSRVGPDPATTPVRDLNPTPSFHAAKGQVCNGIIQH